MPFEGVVRTQWCDDGIHHIVLEDFTFIDKAGVRWTVKSGFKTDVASIPRMFWTIIGPPCGPGKYRNAAILHDHAYATPGMNKSHADSMLYEAMLELGCDRLTADFIYEGVNIGGQSSFDEDQRIARLLAAG